MKGYRFKRSCFVFCFVIGIFLLVSANPSFSMVYCVDNASGLQAALDEAATSDEDDIVKIELGTYNGNFISLTNLYQGFVNILNFLFDEYLGLSIAQTMIVCV